MMPLRFSNLLLLLLLTPAPIAISCLRPSTGAQQMDYEDCENICGQNGVGVRMKCKAHTTCAKIGFSFYYYLSAEIMCIIMHANLILIHSGMFRLTQTHRTQKNVVSRSTLLNL